MLLSISPYRVLYYNIVCNIIDFYSGLKAPHMAEKIVSWRGPLACAQLLGLSSIIIFL